MRPGASSAAERRGRQGRLYNTDRPGEVSACRRSSPASVGPATSSPVLRAVGGGYGDPLERDPPKVLDDVLDGFFTVEHARAAYGVVVDPVAETVDATATQAHSRTHAVIAAAGGEAAEKPRATPRDPHAPPAGCPSIAPPAARRQPAGGAAIPPADADASEATPLAREALSGLRDAYGDAWSFEIVRHSADGNTIEVVGQLRANGRPCAKPLALLARQGRSLGELLERKPPTTASRSASKSLLATDGEARRREGGASWSKGKDRGRPWSKERQSSSRPWSFSYYRRAGVPDRLVGFARRSVNANGRERRRWRAGSNYRPQLVRVHARPDLPCSRSGVRHLDDFPAAAIGSGAKRSKIGAPIAARRLCGGHDCACGYRPCRFAHLCACSIVAAGGSAPTRRCRARGSRRTSRRGCCRPPPSPSPLRILGLLCWSWRSCCCAGSRSRRPRNTR